MNLEKLKRLQLEIAKRVELKDKYSIDEVKYVIGVDQAFLKDYVISAVVRMKYPSLEIDEKAYTVERVEFPYIPTFLMFREGDPAVKAVKKVLKDKSVIVVDGSGIAHPRRCGLATYIAVKTNEPSIGVTKKKLFGEVKLEKGLFVLKDGDETIGYEIRFKRFKPIYVSPGSYISLNTTLQIIKSCLRGHRLPEPIREAHNFANEIKRKLSSIIV